MPVVSNTSPISNLAISGRLDLLHEQLGEVLIPPAVETELLRHPLPKSLQRITAAIESGRIRVEQLPRPVPEHLTALDPGESEALALALEIKASRIVIDESLARRHAARLGLAHVGILGLLRHARRTGQIDSLAEEISKLRAEARFFVSQSLEHRLLVSVGEAT